MRSDSPVITRHRALDVLCIGLPALLFAALALTSLTARPMWRDEMATREFALLPGPDLLRATQHVDLVLLPYYALMHFPARVGDGIAAMRLVSAIAAIVVVALVGVTGRLLWGRLAALAGGLVLATNGYFLASTALQARPGALAQLGLMTAAVAAILVNRAGPSPWRAAALIGGGVAAVLMQPLAVLLVIPFLLVVIRRGPGQRVLAVAATVVTLCAGVFLLVTHSQAAQIHWLRLPTPRTAVWEFQNWSGLHAEYLVLAILLAAVVVQLAGRRFDPAWWVWVVAVVAPPLCLYLVSYFYTPLFYPRYAVLFTPALAVLLGGSTALVVMPLRHARLRTGVAIVVVVILLVSTAPDLRRAYRQDRGIDNIATMSSVLSSKVQPGDTIVFLSSFSANGWTYGVAYYGGDTAMQRDVWDTLPEGVEWTQVVRKVVDVDPLRTVATNELAGQIWVLESDRSTDRPLGLRESCPRSSHGIMDGVNYERFYCLTPVSVGT